MSETEVYHFLDSGELSFVFKDSTAAHSGQSVVS
jgi:hypothetical protein